MGGKASRDKGKRFELQVAHWLQDHGFEKAMRSAQHSGKAGDAADVVGLPGIHIECKAQEKADIWSWLAQAVGDADGTGNIPVVIWKKNRDPWVVVMLLNDYHTMLARSEDWFPCAVTHRGKNMSLRRWLEGASAYGQDYHHPVIVFIPDDHPNIAAMYAQDFMELYKHGKGLPETKE